MEIDKSLQKAFKEAGFFAKGNSISKREKVIELSKLGYTYREIMNMLKISSTSLVSYYLKGIKIKSKNDLNIEIIVLEEKIKQYREALAWCSGSQDFQIEGKARKGWEKICKPLINH